MLGSTCAFRVKGLIVAGLCRKGTELWWLFYSWHEMDLFFSFDRDFLPKAQAKALIS